MKSHVSRYRPLRGNVFNPLIGLKFLVWMILSAILILLAHDLSSSVIYLGDAGWFVVIPAMPVFQGMVVIGCLLYLLHRWIIAAAPPTLHILTLQNTHITTPPRVFCSFSPFSQVNIRTLAEQLCQEDCELWGKEMLWVQGEDEWRIAYQASTSEVSITWEAFLQAGLQQRFARLP